MVILLLETIQKQMKENKIPLNLDATTKHIHARK
jgi:hypothetical protein